MLEGHGDDLYRYKGSIKYNFSTNVFYRGCPKLLRKHLCEAMENIGNYPSPAAEELNELAASRFGLTPGQFLFTNGATEAFYMIARQYRGTSATILIPTFSEYADACTHNNIEVTSIFRDELDDHPFTSKLAFICNPNNPDGQSIAFMQLTKLIQNHPATVFVIDEAYIEFSLNTASAIPLLARFRNLIVVRSMTKTFAIPGLRLGYLMTSTSIIRQLLNFKMPWSVNSLAIAAARFIFNDYDKNLFNVCQLVAETKAFGQALDQVLWLERSPSDTHYFLIRLKQGKACALKDRLATQHQILIRDASNFKGLEGEYIRVALQDEHANLALIKVLKEMS